MNQIPLELDIVEDCKELRKYFRDIPDFENSEKEQNHAEDKFSIQKFLVRNKYRPSTHPKLAEFQYFEENIRSISCAIRRYFHITLISFDSSDLRRWEKQCDIGVWIKCWKHFDRRSSAAQSYISNLKWLLDLQIDRVVFLDTREWELFLHESQLRYTITFVWTCVSVRRIMRKWRGKRARHKRNVSK